MTSGMVAMAIGGDGGGGSIRLPARWCGLCGLKPQRGRVRAAPHASLWRALGTADPLTRTVADSALDGLGFARASLRANGVASFTSIWKVAGNPAAAAVPAGFTADGPPISVQLVGRPGEEPTLVAVSAQFERVRPWADRLPPIR